MNAFHHRHCRPSQCRQIDAVQSPGRAPLRAGRRSARRDPRPARRRRQARRPVVQGDRYRRSRRRRARQPVGAHAGADGGRDRAGRCGAVPGRCPRRHDRDGSRLCRIWCANRASPPSSSPIKARAVPALPVRWKPSRSVSAIRSRSAPSTPRAWPISTMRCARRCPRQPSRASDRRRAASRGAGPADPPRHCRPAQYRQVDLDQSLARRGAAADRARSRHHPQFNFGRSRLADAGAFASMTPPACAAARGSKRSSKNYRSPMRSTPFASPKW